MLGAELHSVCAGGNGQLKQHSKISSFTLSQFGGIVFMGICISALAEGLNTVCVLEMHIVTEQNPVAYK